MLDIDQIGVIAYVVAGFAVSMIAVKMSGGSLKSWFKNFIGE